jgi:hypothetical protein
MKLKQRVITKFGAGTIVAIEGPYGTQSNPWYQYGVLHDVFPTNIPRIYTNDIMYFYKKELEVTP